LVRLSTEFFIWLVVCKFLICFFPQDFCIFIDFLFHILQCFPYFFYCLPYLIQPFVCNVLEFFQVFIHFFFEFIDHS
jgi:hypothetical protein